MALRNRNRKAIWIAQMLGAALAGCCITLVLIYVAVSSGKPELSIWHLATLDAEYRAGSPVTDFAGYLALERRLFDQVDERVYANVPPGPDNAFNRFSRDSQSDPGRWPVNWNRSFEMRHPDSRAGVLLLHGLSDSPYSMRALGESLHSRGATVVGLRLPGHGTAPSGLVDVRWQDMAAAIRLAARHVAATVGDAPLYVVGYSNGGALAIDYALLTLDDDSLPAPAGVVLLSPEIGVSRVAALAVWQGRLGRLIGLDKLAWSELQPEFDPFKYGSFAVNAGDLAHQVTLHLRRRLASFEAENRLGQLPPILAFQSGVDATVTASALVEDLFGRLPQAGHELVLFDVNRRAEMAMVLRNDPRAVFEPLLLSSRRHYDLTIVTNAAESSSQAIATTTIAGQDTPSETREAGHWPPDVYSLSHVALPVSPDDPVYGGPAATNSPGIQIGNLALRGERGVLQVSGDNALRLRWNPFFAYVEERLLEFTGLEGSSRVESAP